MLSPGSRVGPYEVLSSLGAGGMGEVYRARDTRLARDVAIKVLAEGAASHPDRLRRFEKEARSASALNHPSIVTVYDIGSSDSTSYIAMELVEGVTLRQALVPGALPLKRLLSVAVQVADGLAKAHGAGIVHRDLKPENLMVTHDGFAKILDFGLAKLTQVSDDRSEESGLPTVTKGTEPGVVMGTVGYMSPEQASGRPLDFRSDQFSFGSILYEMATGKRAFAQPTAAETLAAIIREEPEPIAILNSKVPAPVRWIVERCLAKEPRARYASTEDLARELSTVRDHLSEATSATGTQEFTSPRASRRWWIPAAIGTVVLLAASVAGWRLRQSDYFWKNPLADARFTRFTDWENSERDATISADGKFVAFTSDRAGIFDVWVGHVGGGEFLNLSKGRFADLANPFVRGLGFSDDGARLSVYDAPAGMLWLVPTMGGDPRPFVRNGISAAWSPDRGRVLYHSLLPGDPIFIADRGGNNPKQIFIGKPGVHNHYPTWSPDGRFVYFASGVPPLDMDLWRIPSQGGAAERLTHHRSTIGWPTLIDDRTLLYTEVGHDGAAGLYAMDLERRIPHRAGLGVEEYLSLASSADGRRLVATVANPTHLLWTATISDQVLNDSSLTNLRLSTTHVGAPRFGPDYVVFLSSRGGPAGLWKFKDGSETELWNGNLGAIAGAPAVSRDGAQIAFVVREQGRGVLHVMASDGTNVHRVAETLDVRDTPSWSPDGKWIAVVVREAESKPIFKVAVDGGEPLRLVDGMLFDPVWSPDGRLILYSDGSQGGPAVSLRAVTPDKQPVQLPKLPPVGYAGNRYRFLGDGKSLILMRGILWRQNFFRVDLSTGQLRQLTDLGPQYQIRSFDVSPDGKQILFDRYRENSDVVLIDLPPR